MNWLVKFTDNWADEMDIEGFTIMSSADFVEWAKLVEDVANKIDSGCPYTYWLGTNEYVDYDSGKDFKACFDCDVIDNEQTAIIKSFLMGGCHKFGFFPDDSDLVYFLERKE